MLKLMLDGTYKSVVSKLPGAICSLLSFLIQPAFAFVYFQLTDTKATHFLYIPWYM